VNHPPLRDDLRWQRLQKGKWTCSSCDLQHDGLFALACNAPAPWDGSDEQAPNEALLSSNHVLTNDFCVLHGQDYFVRCVLRIPILGSDDEHLEYGVWSSLSEKNFQLYRDTFDSGDQSELGPWFGWFSNQLPDYPQTLMLKCHVHPQAERKRPLLELEPTDHPLAVEQRNGITLERLLEIYAHNGHDFRGALAD
jgi:hypothetical protein